MIPAIGYMIGFYIITKMLSLILGKHNGNERTLTIIFAAITIIVAVFSMFILFSSELKTLDSSLFQ